MHIYTCICMYVLNVLRDLIDLLECVRKALWWKLITYRYNINKGPSISL